MKVTHYWYMGDERIKNPISGFENHLIVLLQNLSKNNVDVELIINYSYTGPIFYETIEKLKSAGVEVTCFFRRDDFQLPKNQFQKYKYHLSNSFRLYKLFRKRKDRIFHFHLDLVWTPLIAIFSSISKMVLSVHNDEPFFLKQRYKKWFKLIQRLRPGIQFIAITDHVRNHMITAGINPMRITRIYYGVPVKSQSPKVRFFDNDNITVGTIGRLTVQKNLPILIEAISFLENVNLVIIGEGVLYSKLVNMADNFGISNRVKFTGYIRDAALHINSFDIFCLPSDWEGLGIVLIEAMYAKTLIVGSNAGAIPEILGHGKYGVVFQKGEPLSLKEKLLAIMQSGLNHEMIEQAYKYACDTFTVETMVRNTIKVYKELN